MTVEAATEPLIATMLARLETEHGDPLAAPDYITSVANSMTPATSPTSSSRWRSAVFFDRP